MHQKKYQWFCLYNSGGSKRYTCRHCGFNCGDCNSVFCYACYADKDYRCPKCGKK